MVHGGNVESDRDRMDDSKKGISQMIMRYTYADGKVEIEIHCGCCGLFFLTTPGGTIFCEACKNGAHPNCRMADILGVKN